MMQINFNFYKMTMTSENENLYFVAFAIIVNFKSLHFCNVCQSSCSFLLVSCQLYI